MDIETIDNVSYVSMNQITKTLNLKTKKHTNNNKVTIYFKKDSITLSGSSSFFKINNHLLHFYSPVINRNNDFLIPIKTFIYHLDNNNISHSLSIDSSGKNVILNQPSYNIVGYKVIEKNNGYLIELSTLKAFNEKLIPVWKTDNNWISINVPNGVADSLTIANKPIIYPVNEIAIEHMENSVQISFLLSITTDDEEISVSNNKIIIKLYTAQKENAKKIKEEKQKYIIDTVVLDAGHGGKDPGACTKRCKIKEKDITLSIVKKIGDKLEKDYGINVIYTRTDDIFLSLKDRTNIANSNHGDIFISIHANSTNNSSRTRGFETYLLRIGKTQEAINEVEKRENSVISQYEQSSDNYNVLSKKAIIIQSANVKQSEYLANTIQDELSKHIHKKYNRGVKQAGFQVLWGATMPNVLIEVGFITNTEEAKNLTTSKYQNQIANGIVNAIINYKNKYEQNLFK